MAEKNLNGLFLRGVFVSLTPNPFTGSDGQSVNQQILKIHDPDGFAYHEIKGTNTDALVLTNALAGVTPGTEVTVRLDLTKTGKLRPLSVVIG